MFLHKVIIFPCNDTGYFHVIKKTLYEAVVNSAVSNMPVQC
jgi:hypothetical protein